jgi:protein-L-isoaspartate(D-aspartate) O-methyltransferase
MTVSSSVQAHRDFYANFIVKSAGSSDERLIAAFSITDRAHYVGPGPWPIFVNSGYLSTLSDDPVFLYQDILVGLATERGINNGQPSLHARCLAACSVRFDERVVHVGAGTGYYTAILAALVGSGGHVTAYEIEDDLARRARTNLKHLPNVAVVGSSASTGELPNADLIYVNAGATHPLPTWLDALSIGGRLIFPLTPNEGFGVMLLITRQGSQSYAATVVMSVAFIPCIGARDDATSKAISAAVRTRAIMGTKSLHRSSVPDATVRCAGEGWWLSSAEPAQADGR